MGCRPNLLKVVASFVVYARKHAPHSWRCFSLVATAVLTLSTLKTLTRDGRESEDNARPVSATPKVGLRWWNLARGRDGAGRGVSRGEWRPTRPTDGGPTAEDGLGLDDSRAAAHRSGQRRSTSFPLGKASGRPTGTTRPPRSLTVLSPRLRAPPTQNKTKQQNQPPKQKTTSPPQPTVAPTKARPYRAINEFPSPPRA